MPSHNVFITKEANDMLGELKKNPIIIKDYLEGRTTKADIIGFIASAAIKKIYKKASVDVEKVIEVYPSAYIKNTLGKTLLVIPNKNLYLDISLDNKVIFPNFKTGEK